jgi:two-component system, NarL family, sensor histidine kinase UhpB
MPDAPPSPTPTSGTNPWASRLLRVSLYAKIVGSATLLIGGAVVAGALVARSAPDPFVKGWLALGVLLVAGANALIVHLALRPLRAIGSVVRRVEMGDLEARVPVSPLADREMTRVVKVVNRMLDALAAARSRERSLAARIAQAEEMERKRLANELLDGTAQLMSSVLVQIRLARRGLPEPLPGALAPTGAALEAARREGSEALEGIARIARGLRPPELDELGPIRALEVQARHLTRGTKVQVEMEGEPLEKCLDADGALALYRILQEGLSNALQHGNPTRVRIRYRLAGDRVRVDLSDDGSGFDVSAATASPDRHLGILRMHERARYAGGRLRLSSVPGQGTRLRLELPRAPRSFTHPDIGSPRDRESGSGPPPAR